MSSVGKYKGTLKHLFWREKKASEIYLTGWNDSFETQDLFTKAYFTHTTIMGSWYMQEYSDLNLYWAGNDRFCGGFSPFLVLETVHSSCIFWDAACELIKNLATFIPEKVTRFLQNPQNW